MDQRKRSRPTRTEPVAAETPAAAGPFLRGWTFVKSVPTLEHLPQAGPLEIALAGRSNVGKSSLINALIRHKGMARTSNTPGRTQELNYFIVDGEPRFFLVDMPGYGFAKAPKEKVAAWTELVKAYLRGRQTLARVLVLIDARHGLKPVDNEIMDLLDGAGVTYQVVLTKADKISPAALAKVLEAAVDGLRRHPAAFPHVIATSAEEGTGMDELREAITAVIRERS
ncbi:MAG: ribosome biogenesis GTP-binding protein YihA/YsxC [Hyphomicrobiaceae bacterium]|nr:ribosome biogenesis GTP-binding protein YihA/YsxC [Hyphomicrobiaceae bacterium]